MWEVAEQDRPNVLDCLQCAIVNIHTNNNKSDDENIKTFLVTNDAVQWIESGLHTS